MRGDRAASPAAALVQPVLAAVVAVVLYVVAVRLRVGDPDIDRRLLLVFLGALVVGRLVLALRDSSSPRRLPPGGLLDRLASPPAVGPRADPPGLRQASSSVTLARRSAAGRDRWLRADVRAVVEARLGAPLVVPHGAGPDPDAPATGTTAVPGGAAAAGRIPLERILAPETWSLVRPDRPAGAVGEPGISAADLDRVLTDLEQL